MTNQILIAIASILAVPIIGGLLRGFDRKMTARMQSRIGPPILQPFYDVIKLWNKEKNITHKNQLIWAYGYFGFIITSILVFALGRDILMMLFVLVLAGVCLVLGALSIKSPYSHLGGNRELIQMLAYEPMLFLIALAVFLSTGSFNVNVIIASGTPLIYSLPLAFIAMVIVMVIKMRKSPFDISLSHHAHQEIVRGPVTEFSGKYLALIELAEWYEMVLLLAILAMFWAMPFWAGIILALAVYFIVLIIDNVFARLTWPILLKFTWTFGIGLVILNILGIYLLRK
ncbi:MAG: NADH-quinone oxidoreductase subunit H [Planctomycetes bacterium]|nr:NADH-quinone oxidoreductase subunit H [Planctomycetota bacterium]